jgi:hypothetical protein
MDRKQQLADSFSSEGDTSSRTNHSTPLNAEGNTENNANPSQETAGMTVGVNRVTPNASYDQPEKPQPLVSMVYHT